MYLHIPGSSQTHHRLIAAGQPSETSSRHRGAFVVLAPSPETAMHPFEKGAQQPADLAQRWPVNSAQAYFPFPAHPAALR